MLSGGLVRYEWLLFELAVVGWAFWELWSLRRDRRRAERKKASETDPTVTDRPQGPAS